MARKGAGPSTPTLLGWALGVLLLGFCLGLAFSQQACDRKGRKPAPRAPIEAPLKPAQRPTPPPKPAAKEEPEPSLPRLALIIDDLGYAAPELVTRLCAQKIAFSVAVLPYQEYSHESADIAHRQGKEVLLHLPMEGAAPANPGPNALLYDLPQAEIRARTRKALADVPHRAGANNHMGSRMTADRTRMRWVLEEFKGKQLFFVDSRTTKDTVAYDVAKELGILSAQRQVFLDDDKAFAEIEKQWNRALKLAHKDSQVLVIGHIYPETVEALEKLVPKSRGTVKFVKAGEMVK